MALAYQPPGVSVDEVVTPSVNPLLATPANVCIIGPAQGYVQATDFLALTNEDNIRLPRLPDGATLVNPVLSVSNINNVAGPYTENTDYIVNYASAVNEVQKVTLTGATGGSFKLKFGEETTANIAYNALASAVETALEALGNLETADVAVSGSAGGPYTITFSGQYADVDVPELVADGALLTGTTPTVTVLTTTEGGVTGTIRRVSAGAIEQGETVQVVYRYVPTNYYTATRLNDPSTVEQLYGDAIDDNGNIASVVSFSASCAFENGARDVIIAPLFRLEDPQDESSSRLAPSDAQIQDSATWAQTLVGLRDIDDINVLIPSIGQSHSGVSDAEVYSIFAALQDHVRYMSDQEQYIEAIVAEDSSASSSAATKDILRTHVTALRSRHGGLVNEQIVYLNSSKFGRINPRSGQEVFVGGQYAAAAFGGMLASRPVSSSLTREALSGFTRVADFPPRSKGDKNIDANLGLCVVENTKLGNVQVRHSITTDTSSSARREVSVVRAKHRMIESVRDTLETQIIGKVIADGRAPAVVAAAVGGVLEQLKVVGDLEDYKEVQARTLAIEPTTVEVRFSYKPLFPLNYIQIKFSIDLTDDGGVTII
jgi:hypothetical protein